MAVTFVERIAQAQDLVAIQILEGEISSQEIVLRGLSNAGTAQKAAARALAALGYPLASLEIDADRVAWAFRPGTVFKLVWPPLGILSMVCRVAKLGTGRLDMGRIQLEVLEDVFGVDWAAYATPPDSAWEDPSETMVPPLTAQVAMSAPYVAVAGLLPPPSGFQRGIVMATRGEPGLSIGYRAYVAKEDPAPYDPPEEWYDPVDVPLLTPSGLLASAIDELTTEIAVSSGIDTALIASVTDSEFGEGANVAWLYHDGSQPWPIPDTAPVEEFVAFRDVVQGDGTITIQVLARGCLDTAPAPFPAGTRIWFLSQGSEVVQIRGPVPPATDLMNAITFQPYNSENEYPFNMLDFVELPTGLPPRCDKVYCPTAVQFNGASYPTSITGELTVSWFHRNRLGVWTYADSGKTASGEPGTEYDILVYGELDTLVHTETGVTGTSWLYPSATEIAESGLGRLNNHLRIILRTYGDSRAHQALREIEWEFDRV